jgi:hypothetical protein
MTAGMDNLALLGTLTVASNPHVPEGYFVAWLRGEVMSWGPIGSGEFPSEADRVSLNPADYARLARFEAEMEAHGHA